MIILDTNVLSDLTRDDSPARAWVKSRTDESLWLAATTVTEIVFGLERLPAGRRRDALRAHWTGLLEVWAGRVLPVTLEIAHESGVILAQRAALGRVIPLADAQIAATARVHGASLATRNTKDFEGLGIDLIDPRAA